MANNDVQHLLDMLYEMIDGAKNAPLTSDKCILNRDEALDLLDEIRAQLPVELSRAQELIRAKEDYVKAAKRDVERMMQQAEQDAKNKVSETEVLGIAREKSHEIVKKAEDRSRGQRVHRGRAAPHRGGHPDGARGGQAVPRALPRRLCRADAEAPRGAGTVSRKADTERIKFCQK